MPTRFKLAAKAAATPDLRASFFAGYLAKRFVAGYMANNLCQLGGPNI